MKQYEKRETHPVRLPKVIISGFRPQEKESEEIPSRKRFRGGLTGAVMILVVVSAILILIVSQRMPVMKIYGNSMEPTLAEGSYVVAVKKSDFQTGDLIAFRFSNKILVKRVIAMPGDQVDIDESGNVLVNGTLLDEPYVDEPAKGNCDIEFPFEVPEGRWFVLSDQRSVSQDSRIQMIGCIDEEQIVGQILFTIWPLTQIGIVTS